MENPNEDVIWLKAGKRIYPGSKFEIIEKGSVRALILHEVVKSDESEYSCALKTDLSVKSTATIFVDTSMLKNLSY